MKLFIKKKLLSIKESFHFKIEDFLSVLIPFVSEKTRHYIVQELEITKRYLESEVSQKISWLARCVSHVGDGPLYILMLIIFVLSEKYQMALTFSVAYAVGGGCFVFIKNKAKRDRPFNVSDDIKPFKVPIDQYSFPSGHATMAFLTASVFVSFFPNWAIAVYTLALGIGMSRFALGVHYLTDVFCGAIIGYTIGKIVFLLMS